MTQPFKHQTDLHFCHFCREPLSPGKPRAEEARGTPQVLMTHRGCDTRPGGQNRRGCFLPGHALKPQGATPPPDFNVYNKTGQTNPGSGPQGSFLTGFLYSLSLIKFCERFGAKSQTLSEFCFLVSAEPMDCVH